MNTICRKVGIGWYIFLGMFSILIVWSLLVTIKLAVLSPKSYLFMAIGLAVYAIVNKYIYAVPSFVRTLSHEVSHMVACWLLFQKVTDLNVREHSGEVYHISGPNFTAPFISLAPYCLPLLTYMFLFIRVIIALEFSWITDLFIGLSVAFYIHNFHADTGTHQTDINQFTNNDYPHCTEA